MKELKELKEFKPALSFLAKFLIIYIVGNILYGLYIESYGDSADSFTYFVSKNANDFLKYCGYNCSTQANQNAPTIFIKENDTVILSVFEGCNGLNVAIIFIAFVFAFNGDKRKMLWYIPAGLIIVHLFNILRISLLYHVSLTRPDYFYYFHKYIFTGFIYLVVFGLWALWIKLNGRKERT